MVNADTVASACRRLGFLDENGRLKQLDSLQQVDLVIEAEQVLGVTIPPALLLPAVFESLESFTAFLDGLTAAA